MEGRARVVIENIKPELNHGIFPVKRVINETVEVSADIFCDGHDAVRAELLYRHQADTQWKTEEMTLVANDRFHASFVAEKQGIYQYTVRAWVDRIKTWRMDILKKLNAGVSTDLDFEMGAQLVREVISENKELETYDRAYLEHIIKLFSAEGGQKEKSPPLVKNEFYNIIKKYPARNFATNYESLLKVSVERLKAGFSAWYEFFPRSLATTDENYGTFRDCIHHLPYIAEMGFDVIYLPPVHPVGETKRKGKNNSTGSQPGDPGSPWAIGSKEGGHKSVNRQLGTIHDFRSLVGEAKKYNIEIAIDIALQCSPDHPYIKDHPEWFRHRPDGSIQYAENPPKKYEDIYPFNFECDDWRNLWEELKSIFTFWIGQGVNIFRVDNPHTKPFVFWGWLISSIHEEHPGTIFLSEAFTRPKVMYQLAKQGFTQSYTYFTWRNTRQELVKYFEELVNTEVSEFFRPNLWPNTPDILPEFLQVSGRPGFIIRLVLAATLGSSYGIYGPAFELMDNTAKEPGSEEYLNSEKYEIKNWDLRSRKSLRPLVKLINKARNENPAFRNNSSLVFHDTENENLIAYSKHTDDFKNIVLIVVNLDPYHTHSGMVHLPDVDFGIIPGETYQMHDLLGGAYYLWNGNVNFVELNPGIMPAHIFRFRRKLRTEHDFDYFM